MNTSDQATPHQASEHQTEGWYALRQRAAHAMTHFRPGETSAADDARRLAIVSRWGLIPAEIRDEPSQVVVTLEIPGMDPGDFEIEVEADVLSIRGEKRIAEANIDGHWTVQERAFGAFERSLRLPAVVNRDQTTANYR